MARKIQLVSELADQTAREVTQNVDNWKHYLHTASRLYKYSFNDQLLIYAQRPDATACAAMEIWNDKMRRWVKAGAKGIALIHESESGRPRLEYVFDVADPVQYAAQRCRIFGKCGRNTMHLSLPHWKTSMERAAHRILENA